MAEITDVTTDATTDAQNSGTGENIDKRIHDALSSLHIFSEEAERLKPVFIPELKALADALGGGVYRGITYLTGAPGVGKTALALQLYNQNYDLDDTLDFYFLSLELSREEITKRILQIRGVSPYFFNNPAILTNEQKRDAVAIMEDFAKKKKEKRHFSSIRSKKSISTIEDISDFICERYNNYRQMYWEDTDEIRKLFDNMSPEMQEEQRNNPRLNYIEDFTKSLVVIDYLQLIESEYYPSDQTGRVTAAAKDLSELPRSELTEEKPCAVLCVSSMSRTGYTKPRELSSMAGSSSIEYDAECVMVLERDDDYKPGSESEAAWMEQTGITRSNLTITKNRHGKTPVTIPLWFDGARGRFFEPKSLQDQPAK